MIELAFKVTLLLAVPSLLAFWPKLTSAELRTHITLTVFSGLFVMLVTVTFAQEVTIWYVASDPIVGQDSVQQKSAITNGSTSSSWRDMSLHGGIFESSNPAQYGDWIWWLFGFVTLSLILRTGLQAWRCQRFVSGLPDCMDASVIELLSDAQRQQGMVKKVLLKVHQQSASPFTWGAFRPVIAVPTQFASWSKLQQMHAMQHELAHVRRNHSTTLTFVRALTAVLWWQPLAWWLLHNYRLDIERTCDDDVVRAGANPNEYAKHIIDVARHNDLVPGNAIPMAAGGALNNRIRALLTEKQRRSFMSKSAYRTIWLGVALFAYGLGVSQVSASPPDNRGYLPVIKAEPVYPELAQQDRIEGYVVVEFEVSAQGLPSDIRVVEQEPKNGVFAQSAIDAAANFYYLPARRNGENVPTPGIRNRITFALDESTGDKNAIPAELVEIAEYSRTSAQTRREFSAELKPQIELAEQSDDGRQFAALAEYALDTDPAMAEYLFLRASQLGSADMDYVKFVGGQVMFKRGALAQAKVLFSQISDTNSATHKSAQQWIVYLDRELKRQTAVRAELMDLHATQT